MEGLGPGAISSCSTILTPGMLAHSERWSFGNGGTGGKIVPGGMGIAAVRPDYPAMPARFARKSIDHPETM